MKSKLLSLLILVALTYTSFAQGPPPPCGLSPVDVCDVDLDGEIEVNLSEVFPFNFCHVNPDRVSDYFPLTCYLTQEDADNAINAINSENFVTSIVSQTIYRRADPINSAEDPVLTSFDTLNIGIKASSSSPTPLVACEGENQGFAMFDLSSKFAEIRAGQTGYWIRFHETYEDAINLDNPLPLDYTNTVAFEQTVYASLALVNAPLQYNCVEVVEFDLIVDTVCDDIAVDLVRISAPPRPGFTYRMSLYISNEALPTVENGTVEFLYDDNLLFEYMYLSNANISSTPITNGFNFTFNDLETNETVFINLAFEVPNDLPLGTFITSTATYLTDDNDINALNNSSTLIDEVVGSYDPNDIMESHGPEILYDEFVGADEYLYYTIRFQNVGTAEALEVRIEDELDSQLDESTFQMLHSSHNYSLNRVGNSLEWMFSDINLPAEQDDAEGSNGFVYYKIKPNPGYMVGDIIPNSAAIYFDFNAPIITNTFETEFVEDETLYIADLNDFNFIIYPNPAKDIVIIEHNNLENVDVRLFDLQGKSINMNAVYTSNTVKLNVTSLKAGLYFIEVFTNNKSKVKKIIIN